MALEPVKIPQNVYVEDRIIGPVTLKQLAITGVGCGISYGIWSVLTNSGFTSIVTTIVAWIPAVIAAAFAFVKINDISLFKMVLLAIEKSSKPNVRPWKSFPGISINIVTRPPKEVTDPNAPKVIHATSRLTQLTAQLEEEHKRLAHEVNAMQGQTQMTTKMMDTQTDAKESDGQEETVSNNLPVDPSRITAEPLEPHFRLDGIGHVSTLRHPIL